MMKGDNSLLIITLMTMSTMKTILVCGQKTMAAPGQCFCTDDEGLWLSGSHV